MSIPPQCPRCRVSLTFEDCEGVEIDVCPTCSGVFLDKGELTKIGKVEMSKRRRAGAGAGIAASAAAAADAPSRSRALASPAANAAPGPTAKADAELCCPRCSKPMLKDRRGVKDLVTLDICRSHGMWLDRGEMHRLLADASQAEQSLGLPATALEKDGGGKGRRDPATGRLAGLLKAGRLGFIVRPRSS